MSESRLCFGDCLDRLLQVDTASIDLICTDLPYGVLNRGSEAGKWDKSIPLEPLWSEFLRVAKENAAILLFGQGMFSAQLMMSQPKLWKYNLIWHKNNPSGYLNANRMPLREHEDILVFYRKQPTFHPQMKICSKADMNHSRGNLNKNIVNNIYGKRVELPSKVRSEKCPTSILKFNKPHYKGQHPTEKPVDLLRWLIRSYTNKEDVVLDATMGSGSCGVAAMLEGRNFIGIEKDEHWFEVAKNRIEDTKQIPRQGVLCI